ncbi:MAG: hypothetical protein Q4P83_07695 [Spirochaetales bacterium]|nr:hypothetical protein [Spirochaetales bacterium]
MSEKEAASWSKTTGKTVVANSAKEKTITEITDDDDSRVKKIADESITLKASSSHQKKLTKLLQRQRILILQFRKQNLADML